MKSVQSVVKKCLKCAAKLLLSLTFYLLWSNFTKGNGGFAKMEKTVDTRLPHLNYLCNVVYYGEIGYLKAFGLPTNLYACVAYVLRISTRK